MRAKISREAAAILKDPKASEALRQAILNKGGEIILGGKRYIVDSQNWSKSSGKALPGK